jgi:hypothetical protein
LESPAQSLARSAENQQQGGQSEKGKENAGGIGETFGASGGPAFSRELNEVKGLEGKNRKNARHDVEDQSSEKGKQER